MKPRSSDDKSAGFSSTLRQLWEQARQLFALLFLRKNVMTDHKLAFHPNEAPQSLADLVASLQTTDCLWIDEHAFVSHGGKDRFPGAHFGLRLTCARSSRRYILKIHAATIEAAQKCLKYIMDLPDDVYHKVGVWNYDPSFLLEEECLRRILSIPTRHVTFSRMQFGPAHSRVLATCVSRIGFYQCEFVDGGRAFVTGIVNRNDNIGPQTLHISGRPFDEKNWLKFLQNLNRNLDSLLLYGIQFNLENCSAIAKSKIDHLHVDVSRMEDHGAALMEAVSTGHGPRSLSLWNERLGQSAKWSSIFMALESPNCQLQRLELSRVSGDADTVVTALASSLKNNKSLVELNISNTNMSYHCWNNLLEVLSGHSSLRTLNLAMKQAVDRASTRRRTRAVAQLLSKNPNIDNLVFHRSTYEQKEWNEKVTPLLECNRSRHRSLSLQKNENTRAALLASAMTEQHSPLRTWLLLSLNQDTVASHLALSKDRVEGIVGQTNTDGK